MTPQERAVTLAVEPDALAQLAFDLVSIPSPTLEEGAAAQRYARELEAAGLEVRVTEVAPGRPNVVARLHGAGGGPALLLCGHLDTIPIGDCVAPRLESDRLWGRGSEDMKGALAAVAHSARALGKAGVRLAGDLWVGAVVGHESPAGNKEGPLALAEEVRRGAVPAQAVVIVEGPHAIWTMSLGFAIFTMRLESPRGGTHTTHVPIKQSPLLAMARLIQRLDALQDELERGARHPLGGPERINIGIAGGGDYMNRTPGVCTVTGTRRWLPGRTVEDIRAELESLLREVERETDLRCSLVLGSSREPFETATDSAVVKALQTAGETLFGQAPPCIGMALVGDADVFRNGVGVPTVYYGPDYRTAHSDVECVEVERLVECARMYALAAMAFSGVAA